MIIINAKSNQKQAAFNHSSELPFGQKTSHLLVLTISLFLNPIKPWVDVTFCLFCEPCYSWWSNQIFSHTLLLYFSHSSHILVCVWERESVWEPTWMSLSTPPDYTHPVPHAHPVSLLPLHSTATLTVTEWFSYTQPFFPPHTLSWLKTLISDHSTSTVTNSSKTAAPTGALC